MVEHVKGLASLVDAKTIKAVVVDQWGVLHDGVRLFPGVVGALTHLRLRDIPVVMLSNTPRSSAECLRDCTRIGLPPELLSGVVTSGALLHSWLDQINPHNPHNPHNHNNSQSGDGSGVHHPFLGANPFLGAQTMMILGGSEQQLTLALQGRPRTWWQWPRVVQAVEEADVLVVLGDADLVGVEEGRQDGLAAVGGSHPDRHNPSAQRKTRGLLPRAHVILEKAHQRGCCMVVLRGDPVVCLASAPTHLDQQDWQPDGRPDGRPDWQWMSGLFAAHFHQRGGKVFAHNKPYASIFAAAAHALPPLHPSQILMVGDSLVSDVGGALAMGWQTLWISGHHPHPAYLVHPVHPAHPEAVEHAFPHENSLLELEFEILPRAGVPWDQRDVVQRGVTPHFVCSDLRW